MPTPNIDQIRDQRIAPVGYIEVGGGVAACILVALALAQIAPDTLRVIAELALATALLAHPLGILARWHSVGNGGDQGLIRGGALIQLAAAVCAVVLALALLLQRTVPAAYGIAIVVMSGALLVSGPAHALLGPMRPLPLLFGPRFKAGLVIVVVAASAYFSAVYALISQRSVVTMDLAVLFAAIALAVAGLVRNDRAEVRIPTATR